MSQGEEKPVIGVQQKVTEEFLKQLKEQGISGAIVQNLEKIIVSGSTSEINIKKALLPDEAVL